VTEAIAALVGAVVGWLLSILGEPITQALFGPKLEVCFDPNSLVDAHIASVVLEVQDNRVELDAFWVRLRVANTSRRAAADQVELIVRDLARFDDSSGQFRVDSKFLPLSMKWSHIGRPLLDRIPAGIEKHCDFFQILDPSRTLDGFQLTSAPPCQAVLQLEVHPNVNPGILSPGAYSLVVIATASNAPPFRREIHFQIPRDWSSDDRVMIDAINLRGLSTRSSITPNAD
jgi:hypothetical protein